MLRPLISGRPSIRLNTCEATLTSLALNDFEYQGIGRRRCVCNLRRLEQQFFRFVQARRIIGKHRIKRVAGFHRISQFPMDFDSCHGGHGLTGFLASCAEPLNSPADGLAVDLCDISITRRDYVLLHLRRMPGSTLIHPTWVATLRFHQGAE